MASSDSDYDYTGDDDDDDDEEEEEESEYSEDEEEDDDDDDDDDYDEEQEEDDDDSEYSLEEEEEEEDQEEDDENSAEEEQEEEGSESSGEDEQVPALEHGEEAEPDEISEGPLPGTPVDPIPEDHHPGRQIQQPDTKEEPQTQGDSADLAPGCGGEEGIGTVSADLHKVKLDDSSAAT